MPPVKEATEYKTPRQWLMAEFRARPRTIITLDELLARKSGWSEKQIRASIANIRHERGDRFPLRVAGTTPRADGRPGSPSASAWIYEPKPAEVPLPEPDEEPEDEVDTDLSDEQPSDTADEGYRWTPLATGQNLSGALGVVASNRPGQVPVLADQPTEKIGVDVYRSNGNGRRRTYEELAVTRSGVVLVDDEGGEVYRLVKVLTAHPVDNDL